MKADLHIHSTYSDGTLSPAGIVSLAGEKGLSILGITDHDTASHFPECIRESRKSGMTVIPGVEFSTRFKDSELHIIGYALDHKNRELRTHLHRVRSRRFERAREIMARLASRNVHIPEAELDLAPEKATMGRMFIARLLFNHGYVRTIGEAFDRYLGSNGSAFVPYELTDACEVIELIKKSRGVSVFSHPSRPELEAALDTLSEAGLEGIELWRPAITRALANTIKKKALQHKLVLTGGSDWHHDSGWLDLGDFYVDKNRIADFLNLIAEKSPCAQ
ncbi:MAG: PHP domain-containing protein [Deltaproteobacteria bacterium]|nr:PHP domain-containing protein [Deltaproteobacteria bacterium]